ncbi:V4R domain-containing protein [Methanosalsum natronophilum]|uniref:V4R domain-containing protein n=1 Tax=Methanosalsum natronophilum TaxID=768733 RepID=UPI00216A20C1|nr:V4R domain-containing protein [Methanosalsum natronophilum]MCS3924525.1 putative hydrocarbon binding protein [Methanosalsum natronophilum]
MRKLSDSTALFTTMYGFIALNGEVKLQILELLKEGPCTFEELVRYTGKAKSTISVHLRDLSSCKLVEERLNNCDRRKKEYILTSCCLGSSQQPVQKHYKCILNNFSYLKNNDHNKTEFFMSMYHAIRFGFEAYGLNHYPIMKKIGFDIGTSLAHNFNSSNISSLFYDISEFWSENELGNLEFFEDSGINIRITDCIGCSTMPVMNKKLCSFEEGIFEGLLTSKIDYVAKVTESECCGTGHPHCLFVVKLKKTIES